MKKNEGLIMDKEDGMISISMLIVLSLMAVFSLYIYRLSLTENDSLEILKMNMQTKNYTISESLNLIDKYDKEKWQDDCMKAQGKDEFDEAIVVDEKTVMDKQMKKSVKIKAYLMQIYNQDIYKLIVESSLEDITNQNCIYLQKKDDDCIVQRWER